MFPKFSRVLVPHLGTAIRYSKWDPTTLHRFLLLATWGFSMQVRIPDDPSWMVFADSNSFVVCWWSFWVMKQPIWISFRKICISIKPRNKGRQSHVCETLESQNSLGDQRKWIFFNCGVKCPCTQNLNYNAI